MNFTNDELNLAHDRWRDAFPSTPLRDWGDFLCGWPTFVTMTTTPSKCWSVSEEGGRRMQMLLSPHWKSLIKVMQIRADNG